jgi:AAA domain
MAKIAFLLLMRSCDLAIFYMPKGTNESMNDDMNLRRASDMAPSEPVNWLLGPGYLAKGKVNLLVGAEGIGKSLWIIQAITAVTTGQSWGPFAISDNAADVVLFATEDGFADTVRPRLEVAGAKLERVHVLSAEQDGSGPPTTDDFPVLKNSGIAPALLAVDAWIDTVPGKFNVKDPQQCRAAMRPYQNYAADSGAAVLAVTHANRSASGSARDRYGLSGALRQITRSSIYALEDPDSEELLVGPEKQNLSRGNAAAQRFRRVSVPKFQPTTGNDGTVPCLEYVGAGDRSVSEIIDASQFEDAQRPSRQRKKDAIVKFLRELLSNDPMAATSVYEWGAEWGYSQDQIYRSKDDAGVEIYKEAEQWWWRLIAT